VPVLSNQRLALFETWERSLPRVARGCLRYPTGQVPRCPWNACKWPY